jgi:octaprenyl-diphosphate synthase
MSERAAPPPALAAALDRLAPALAQVERTMRDHIAAEHRLIGMVGDHVLSAGGKRLRPAILMLAAELCGYGGPRRVQIAAALELLHTATLLHDDVVDLQDKRRGRAAARAIWGNRRAVLVGDYFYAGASTMIVEDGDLDILRIFSDTIAKMAEGELMQLERSFDPDVTEAHYYAVIDRKSASLIAAASESGAILAGVTRAERRRVADFGREFGLAFQLRDDVLDYSAGEDELGKLPYTDVREGKVTLPLLLTLKRCSANEREVIGSTLKTAARRTAELEADGVLSVKDVLDESELSPLLELVRRHRGVEDTNRRAREHVQRAAETIAPFPDGMTKAGLLAAAEYAANRAS